jgi:hypothetical protein
MGRSADVTAVSGEVRTVEMSFAAAEGGGGPPPPPARPGPTSHGPPLLVPAVVAFAVSGAGVAVGAATGVASLEKVSELDQHCPTKRGCAPADRKLADDAKVLGNVSTGAFVVAGVGLTAGLVLALWPSKEHPPRGHSFSPVLGPGYVGVEGAF